MANTWRTKSAHSSTVEMLMTKLYLEFGGKLIGDFPRCAYCQDSIQMEKSNYFTAYAAKQEYYLYTREHRTNKNRGDLRSYDQDVLRLMDDFTIQDLKVTASSSLVTQSACSNTIASSNRGIKVYARLHREGIRWTLKPSLVLQNMAQTNLSGNNSPSSWPLLVPTAEN